MSLLEIITSPANLLSALAVLLLGATVVLLVKPYLHGDDLDNRMKMVANRKEELRRRSRAAIAKDSGLRQRDETLYKKIVERLNLQKLLEDPKVVDKLAQAGLRGPKPVSTYYFFRFMLPFAFAGVVALYVFVLKSNGMQVMQRGAIVFGAFVLGFYAPSIYVKNAAGKRRQSIVRAFPDALDLLLICVESGMSIETAIQRVSQEIGGQSIPLAEELSLLVAELSYLPDRRLAYEGLTRRINDAGVKSVATAMTQAETYGTPLGAALRVMAKENRDLRLTAAEKKAAALPAKLTVPMILFFLPVLFAVIMGPAIIRATDLGALKH